MKTLIIAEKPVIGQEINKILAGEVIFNKDGVIRKGNYIITWAYGHLLRLMPPEGYDEKYKPWNLSLLPIYFNDWKHDTKPDSKGRVQQIGKLLMEADTVIHAGDVDDEGQLLVDELLRYFHYEGAVKRIDTSSLALEDLKKAFANMKENQLYVNLGWAAYARSVADYTVGINISRYFTIKNQTEKPLSVGRVQTPTLGMVVNRDLLIEGHQKVMFYKVFAEVMLDGKEVITELQLDKEDRNCEQGRILDKHYAQEKAVMLTNVILHKISVEKKTERESPPLPFNLVKLQTYCGKKWGYSPKEVMDITQTLREKYKAITYNRSDCQYLSMEHFKEAPEVIQVIKENITVLRDVPVDTTKKSKCFNDGNVTAHHAIIPTKVNVTVSIMTPKEQNVYLVICNYYLAQFLEDTIKEKTTLIVPLESGGCLKAASTRVTQLGYRSLLDVKAEKETVLSQIESGTYEGHSRKAEIKELETKPPERYTKTTLNEDMTRIAKYVKDPYIKQLLLDKDKDKKGENGSIGTSATRSVIIENLVIRGFLEEKGKALVSTSLGRELYRVLPDSIKLADLTAKWWSIMEDIKENGDYHLLTESVLDTVNGIIGKEHPPIDSAVIPKREVTVVGNCPRCRGSVVGTKKGYFCNNKDCSFALFPNMKHFSNEIVITLEKAKELLGVKKKAVFPLISKDGKKYQGYLKIKLNGNYVNFENDGIVKRKVKKG